jgi:YHS domain-containing protein
MKKKKLSKQQLQENQIIEDKKFNRILIISFSLLVITVVSVLTFYTYGCDTRFLYHKWAWYGKEIPGEWACMNGNNLTLHKSLKVAYNNKAYYFCSQECFNHLVKHFTEVAMVPDAYSGDSINKADALIGLKEKGKPELVYFKNAETLSRYYGSGK